MERCNQIVKKVLPWKKLTLFHLLANLEFVMHTVKRRPIGLRDTLNYIRPCDIIPVWSAIQPRTTMMGATRAIQEAQEEFQRRWSELYKTSILRQRKWIKSNHDLQRGDIVYILDLLKDNKLRLAKMN